MYRGQIIAERYAPGFGVHTQYRTWSTAKSITNALVGILVGQGRLEVDAPGSEDVKDDDTLDDDEPVVTGELEPRSVSSWDDDPSDEGLTTLKPPGTPDDALPAADRVTAPAAPGLPLTPAEALAPDEALVDLRPGLRVPAPALIVGALALFALGVGVGLLLSGS